MEAAGSGTVLVVAAGDVRVALPVATVAEVLRMVALTPLPGAPAVVTGLVDVRGVTLPVVDLRRRLGRPSPPPVLDDRLVVIEGANVAVHVDRVEGLSTLDPAGVERLPTDLARTVHLAGVARTDGGLLHVHDPVTFLADHEVADLDRALVATARSAG